MNDYSDKSAAELLEHIEQLERQLAGRELAIELLTEKQLSKWLDQLEELDDEFDNAK